MVGSLVGILWEQDGAAPADLPLGANDSGSSAATG